MKSKSVKRRRHKRDDEHPVSEYYKHSERNNTRVCHMDSSIECTIAYDCKFDNKYECCINAIGNFDAYKCNKCKTKICKFECRRRKYGRTKISTDSKGVGYKLTHIKLRNN